MAAEPESGYQRAARKRWPTATIEGDGPFALLVSCYEAKGVRLYGLYPLAVMDKQQSCGHAFCRMQHSVYIVQPLYDFALPVFDSAADKFRD